MKTESSYMDFDAIGRQERAAYLLAGYIQDDLSMEEEEELDKWINTSDQNLKLFEELTDEKQMAAYLDWYNTRDVEGRLEETRSKIFPARKMVLGSFWKYAAAAALVITGGIIVYVWRSSSTGIEKPPVTQGGSVQSTDPSLPMLKLGDGRIIQLAGIKDTVIDEQVKIVNGAIVYSDKVNKEDVFHELIIPRKTSYQMTLPDGSRVWLNAVSSIRYPSSFTTATREVTVTGETYFEIAKNAAKPFVVIVNGMKVQATGTAFNIKAYPDAPYLGITITEGSVKVSSAIKSRDVRKGEQLQIRNSENWKLEKVDPDDFISWTNGKLKLNDISAQEFKHSLERWYDVTVTIQDKVDIHLNGLFPRDISLTTLLQTLEKTNDVHFKLDGNRVTILK